MSQGKPGGLKAQLKTLIDAKQYEAAIVLLKASDLPDKITFINRIQKQMQKERDAEKPPAERPAAPVKAVPAKRRNYVAWVFLGIAVVLCVMVGVMLNRNYSAQYRAVSAPLDIARICVDIYSGRYPAKQLVNGCDIAAEHTVSLYEKEINYCYDHASDTDAMFVRCLADNDVKIDEVWVATAPKS